MGSSIRIERVLILALLALGLASSGSAGTLTVTYGFAGTGFGFDYNGATTGVATLRVGAVSATQPTIAVGPVLLSLKIVPGTATPGPTLFSTGPRTLSGVMLSETGAVVSLKGQFFANAFDFGTVSLTFANLQNSGDGSISGTARFGRYTGTYGTGVATQSFGWTGQEISRMFVPEAGGAPLLVLAALSMAGLARARRRRGGG